MDVTNIVTPVVSVITNIGMDHTDVLGDTIEQIAEKRQVSLNRVYRLLPAQLNLKPVKVIQETAQQLRSTVYLAGEQFSYHRLDGDENGQSFSFYRTCSVS